ncbi:hypothetical protein [Endozoicomonas arenosclerae]|uniref:hypothetical protein n=1 Tax=Endozoicomonas arenosclerae TaxID=1633495 RepID=UPI00078446FD|nr:hypothetical protein [Endozoicomonas arenosclerae]
MDMTAKTFVYNGTHYVQYFEPTNTTVAADFMDKNATLIQSAQNYINGCIAPYIAPVTSRIADLQAAAKTWLPDAVTSAVGQEVAVEGVGSTSVGTIATLVGPTVLPVVNYLRNSWNRSSELVQVKSENNKALKTALQQAARDSDAAFATTIKQIKNSDTKAQQHEKNAKDSFFSFKNMMKHSVTVLAPFCVLPQVGFTVAATAAVVGITARAITHVLNHRAEAKLCAQEREDTDTLRQFNHELERRLGFEDALTERNQDLGRKQGELETVLEQLRTAQNVIKALDENAEEAFLDAPEDTVENRLREQLQEANRNLGIAEALIDAGVDDLRRENEHYKEENRRLRAIEQEHILLQQEIEEVQNL